MYEYYKCSQLSVMEIPVLNISDCIYADLSAIVFSTLTVNMNSRYIYDRLSVKLRAFIGQPSLDVEL